MTLLLEFKALGNQLLTLRYCVTTYKALGSSLINSPHSTKTYSRKQDQRNTHALIQKPYKRKLNLLKNSL